jgi:hypothetical protein
VWAAAIIAAAPAGAAAATGVALGGGITLASLALHLSLAAQWRRRLQPRRSARIYLWFLWLAKWPLVGTALWYCLTRGVASPVWVCVGAAVVPAVATALALRRAPRGGRLQLKGSVNASA